MSAHSVKLLIPLSWIISTVICLQGLIRLVVQILYFTTLMPSLMVLVLLQHLLIPHVLNLPQRNTKFSPWLTSTNTLNTDNDNDATAPSTSEDPPTNNNATLSPENELLLSMEFPLHSLMVNHFQEYATTKGFLLLDYPKQYFTTTEYSNNFPGESNQSLGSKTTLPTE